MTRRRRSPQGSKLYEVKDVAKRLDVHKTTVYRWIDRGLLHASKNNRWGVYLVTEAEIKRFQRKFLE